MISNTIYWKGLIAPFSGKSAVSLRIAEQFIEEFGFIISEADTSVLPADLANLKGVIQSLITGAEQQGIKLELPEKARK